MSLVIIITMPSYPTMRHKSYSNMVICTLLVKERLELMISPRCISQKGVEQKCCKSTKTPNLLIQQSYIATLLKFTSA